MDVSTYDGDCYTEDDVYYGKWDGINTNNKKNVFTSIYGRVEIFGGADLHGPRQYFVKLKDGYVHVANNKYEGREKDEQYSIE